jgi:hypothetical protein
MPELMSVHQFHKSAFSQLPASSDVPVSLSSSCSSNRKMHPVIRKVQVFFFHGLVISKTPVPVFFQVDKYNAAGIQLSA